MLAVNLLGAIAVPLNFRPTGSEAAYILNDSGARIVLADALPRNASGKVLKDVLRNEAMDA